MSEHTEALYAKRLRRYVTAMRNEKPDCIPIRPFVAEFTATYAGFTCQDVTHDYENAFAATRKCAADFDWDAVVGNMVYVWTGLTQAIGLKYYGVPGFDVPADVGFQYIEPSAERAHMRPYEYDALTEDPTGFLFNVWLPRVAAPVSAIGEPATYANNLSFLRGGMAMLSYFNSFGGQNALLRSESGTVSAIAGILKAPLDIIADKLRGYVGLVADLIERPEKVLAACEALMPHLLQVALSGADPDHNVPITIWMHRGCVPFISHDQFDTHYWPTLKPIVEAIWAQGHQVLFYAEGDWNAHLDAFAELPDQSIIYHADRGDIFEIHKKLGHKFCISGGIPNYLLSVGGPDEVRDYCRKVIDGVAGDGGYIMDASAIIQNDAKVENIKAMTDFTRENGVYDGASYSPAGESQRAEAPSATPATSAIPESTVPPGVCVPWETKLQGLAPITGDREIARRVWEANDALAYTYIWHCLLSF